jgi:hypothetical protein
VWLQAPQQTGSEGKCRVMCHPFELAWAACSCFAPQNVRAIRLVGLFHLMGGGAPRWMMVVSRCRTQLARWRIIPTHHVPPLSVFCLSVFVAALVQHEPQTFGLGRSMGNHISWDPSQGPSVRC